MTRDASVTGAITIAPIDPPAGVTAESITIAAGAIAIQADDRVPTKRVITAGFASSSNSDFAVTRYWR